MVTVTFLLKEPKSEDKTLINMFVFYGAKKPLKFSVSEKVLPACWNQESKKVRIKRECPEAKGINLKLERYERLAKDAYLLLENTGKIITRDLLKQEIEVVIHRNAEYSEVPVEKFDEDNVLEFYKKRVQELKENNTTNWKAYNTGCNLLQDFCGRSIYHFPDIDYMFFEKFIEFLKNKTYQCGEEDKYYTNNYISNQVKMLKAILNYAAKIGLNKNDSFQAFKKTTESIDNIYLTEDEILRIYNLELKGYLDRARDLFIIGCCTAMRYSDFTQIRPENIHDGFIHYVSQKTAEPTIVPVHWMIEELLKKYDGSFPKAISNQKMNDYLKEIGKLAKIDTPVTKTRTEGGRRVKHTFKKYELITTHTGRRSAATNMYKNGMPSIGIMKITGHRTESAFMAYIKISKEESAKMMADSPFFKKKE